MHVCIHSVSRTPPPQAPNINRKESYCGICMLFYMRYHDFCINKGAKKTHMAHRGSEIDGYWALVIKRPEIPIKFVDFEYLMTQSYF